MPSVSRRSILEKLDGGQVGGPAGRIALFSLFGCTHGVIGSVDKKTGILGHHAKDTEENEA